MNNLQSIEYKKILEDIENLKAYCKNYKIVIPINSYLNKCFNSAKVVSDAWDKKDFEFPKQKNFRYIMNDFIEVFRLTHATKFLLKNNIDIKHNLTKIVETPLDAKDPKPSVGKNYAFELIVAGQLAEVKLDLELKEPDIQFKFRESLISIACKKVYSIKSLGKRLSEARKQIDNNSLPGIIALCLDSLFNHASIFWVNNKIDMVNSLIAFLKNFADSHRALMIKKLNSDKVIAVLLSVSTASNLKKENLFTMARQSILIPINNKYRNFINNFSNVLVYSDLG